jgi:hypothetical protein
MVNVGGLSVFFCLVGSGQTSRQPQDPEAMKDDFVARVFSYCTDSSLNPPRKQYFLGPITAPTGTGAAPTVLEYDRADINLTKDTLHENADDLNHEWHGILVMRFRALRSRSQGLTKPETPLDIFKTKPSACGGCGPSGMTQKLARRSKLAI